MVKFWCPVGNILHSIFNGLYGGRGSCCLPRCHPSWCNLCCVFNPVSRTYTKHLTLQRGTMAFNLILLHISTFIHPNSRIWWQKGPFITIYGPSSRLCEASQQESTENRESLPNRQALNLCSCRAGVPPSHLPHGPIRTPTASRIPGQPVLAFPGPNAILCIQPKGKSTTTTSGIIDGEASPVVDSRMQDNLHRQ